MTDSRKNTGCLICGEGLIYQEHTRTLSCFYCGKEFEALAVCRNGHYVCDRCHQSEAMDLIEKYCVNSKLTDPVKMANLLMRNPAVTMHGPEHHFLIPAVLLCCYYNLTGKTDLKKKKIRYARARAEHVPGGFCGSHGNCGAAVGTGIFVSLVTGATPLSGIEWQWSNLMTSRALEEIALHGGPRCCKRNTFLAIGAAAGYVREILDVNISVPEKIKCSYSDRNRECLKKECPFYA